MTGAYRTRILDTCEKLDQKLTLAAHRLECGQNRTTITLDTEEQMVLTWALRHFWDRVEKAEEVKP